MYELIIPDLRDEPSYKGIKLTKFYFILGHLLFVNSVTTQFVAIELRMPYQIVTTLIFFSLSWANSNNKQLYKYHSVVLEVRRLITKSGWKGN